MPSVCDPPSGVGMGEKKISVSASSHLEPIQGPLVIEEKKTSPGIAQKKGRSLFGRTGRSFSAAGCYPSRSRKVLHRSYKVKGQAGPG